MTDNLQRYSSQVEIYLETGDGVRKSVSHVWGDGLILRHQGEECPCQELAKLTVVVDGVRSVRDVFVHAFDPATRRAAFF